MKGGLAPLFARPGSFILIAIGFLPAPIIRGFAVFNRLPFNPVFATRPKAKVDHLASLGTERPVTIRRTTVGDLFADRATHPLISRKIAT
jgi:hypothetical protein